MTTVTPLAPAATEACGAPRWRPTLTRIEDAGLALMLASMAILPVAEVLLRVFTGAGIAGSAVAVQQLALVVSMAGVAVAAREGRLLCLATTSLVERGRLAPWAKAIGAAVGAAVCAALAGASLDFVVAERAAGSIALRGVPVWWVALTLPAGFALSGVRLLARVPHGVPRGSAVAGACLLAALAAWPPVAPTHLLVPALALIAAATLFGAPIFVTLAGTALAFFWSDGLPVASLALDHYRLVVNPTLPVIPLFTLAGYLLARSGAPVRLVRVFDALFGGIRGGAAVVAVLVCTLFTCFTGASGVTILALGGLLMPMLAAGRLGERRALGLVTGAGAPGVLLAPSLPLILYAIVAQIGIERMFLAGLLPALLMVGITVGWGMVGAPAPHARPRPGRGETARALRAAGWELALPVVVVAALFSGLATPVEAAGLTVLYVLAVEVLVHRELRGRGELIGVITECGLVVGGILVILGVALGLTNVLVDYQVPDAALDWVTATIESRWTFLLALNVFLLAVGCLMDIYSAIVVVVPIVVPIGLAFGIDPLHLGVIFLANLELGYLTPPVGMNLFYAATRFDRPVAEVCRAVAPLIARLAVGVLLITYVPWLATALPGLLDRVP